MKSVLVIGLGRFGLHLAHKLAQLGNEVMVVDQDAARVNQSAQDFADAQIADCTDSDVLRSLGVGQFDVCFVAIFDDFESSLVITSQLRTLGAKTVVSVAKKPVQASILKKIGANEVICPEQEIAEKTPIIPAMIKLVRRLSILTSLFGRNYSITTIIISYFPLLYNSLRKFLGVSHRSHNKIFI